MIKKALKENYLYLLSIVILTILFFVIGKTDIYNKILDFDYKVIEIISNIYNPKIESLMAFITKFGEWYIPTAIIVCIFLFVKNKLYSYILIVNYAVIGLITFLVKSIIMRPRPLVALIEIPLSYSFPSGHTLTSIFFYILLWYLITLNKNNKIKIPLFILFSLLAILVSFSRIYLGVHYFSDVMGGIIYSIPCLLCTLNILNKNFKEKL